MLFILYFIGVIDVDKIIIVDFYNFYCVGVVFIVVFMYKMVSIFLMGIKYCVINFSYFGKFVLKICNLIFIFVLWIGILYLN